MNSQEKGSAVEFPAPGQELYLPFSAADFGATTRTSTFRPTANGGTAAFPDGSVRCRSLAGRRFFGVGGWAAELGVKTRK